MTVSSNRNTAFFHMGCITKMASLCSIYTCCWYPVWDISRAEIVKCRYQSLSLTREADGYKLVQRDSGGHVGCLLAVRSPWQMQFVSGSGRRWSCRTLHFAYKTIIFSLTPGAASHLIPVCQCRVRIRHSLSALFKPSLDKQKRHGRSFLAYIQEHIRKCMYFFVTLVHRKKLSTVVKVQFSIPHHTLVNSYGARTCCCLQRSPVKIQ